MKPAYELLDKEYLTPQEVADAIGVSKGTFMRAYAPRPDFPARISLSRKRNYWRGDEVRNYLNQCKEKRPH